MRNQFAFLLALLCVATTVLADGPRDNIPEKVRRIPPAGIVVPDGDRQALEGELAELGKVINALGLALKEKAELAECIPDVQIYFNAVKYALAFDQFNSVGEIKIAHDLLKQGQERAAQLREGKSPWTTATGPLVRGYVSKIDGSVQPYGLDIPADFEFDPAKKHRLDFWFHGRNEALSELNFINGHAKLESPFHPPGTIVLYPYGRYITATHFAGEVDVLEALDAAKKHYPVDTDRIVVRGFSMGGASTWNFATHYAYKWAAAAPGAGFAETPDFLRSFQKEVIHPTWYEEKLLHWYDCTDWTENLYHLPLVIYSGEKDPQKQAGDIMSAALKKEGIEVVHLIGPGMGHQYDEASKVEIGRRIDEAAAKGRDPMPSHIRFTTYTLHYYRMYWIIVDGMEEHWKRARVEADMDGNEIRVKTENVSRVSLAFDKSPLAAGETFKVIIDGKEMVSLPSKGPGTELTSYFIKKDGAWAVAPWWKDNTVLRKRRYLMGPIDDAFMMHFMFVEPTGTPMNEAVGKWTAAEMQHAIDHWQLQFRGDPIRKKDTEITDDDIKAGSLVLWGDPSSNAILKKIAPRLPIKWTAAGIQVGDKLYTPGEHVPVLIYPNPLDHRRYVVINSGFTYREYDYLNNARQTPKLPDWAIMDITQPRTTQHAAGVADAGFFDEAWELKGKP